MSNCLKSFFSITKHLHCSSRTPPYELNYSQHFLPWVYEITLFTGYHFTSKLIWKLCLKKAMMQIILYCLMTLCCIWLQQGPTAPGCHHSQLFDSAEKWVPKFSRPTARLQKTKVHKKKKNHDLNDHICCMFLNSVMITWYEPIWSIYVSPGQLNLQQFKFRQ